MGRYIMVLELHVSILNVVNLLLFWICHVIPKLKACLQLNYLFEVHVHNFSFDLIYTIKKLYIVIKFQIIMVLL